MAAQEPPTNVPRIEDVLNPSTGHYVVMVRMPTLNASKYPEKPWGTPITSIGLSKQESDRYLDYVLVDVAPMQGTPDLLWVFQKLDGPEWTTKSTGQESLIPQKYRKQITTVRTKQEVDPATEPTAITGNLTSSIVEQQDNTGKATRVDTTEVIQENTNVLEGEEYGTLVTQTVEEKIVVEGTDADTGLDVISSTVDPLGNGKSIKQTKRVKGTTWPDPIDKEVSKEAAGMPPARYRKDLTQTKTTRKIATSAIPTTPALTNKEVAKSYKKETPDRAEETLVVQDFVLNTASVDEAIEQKPFVKIVSRMTPGLTAVVPLTGNGSAKLVWEGPDSNIYENVAEVATAKTGLKGVETDAQQWGKIVTTTNYTTSSTAPLGGSVQLIYNDGSVKIYEAATTSATVSGSTKGIDPNTWGSVTWNGTYSTSSSGEKSRQVWSNGVNNVYLNETSILAVTGITKDIDPNTWGSVTWDGTYSTSTGGEKSSQVWSDGVKNVYLNQTSTLAITGGGYTSATEENQILTETQTTTYGSSPNSGVNTRSRLVYSQNGKNVYENISIVRVAGATKIYAGSVNVNIPATLIDLNLSIFSHKNGAAVYRWEPVFSDGFSGPMAAEVTEYWSTTPSPLVPEVFRPSPISFQTPRGGITIGSCLHGVHNFSIEITGNGDPEYGPQEWAASFPATVPPSSVGMKILADVSAEPYRDGYVIREFYVQL